MNAVKPAAKGRFFSPYMRLKKLLMDTAAPASCKPTVIITPQKDYYSDRNHHVAESLGNKFYSAGPAQS